LSHSRAQAAEARTFIRQLLMTEWNPIGVPDDVDDEYESYAMKSLGIILNGGNATDVVEFLWRSETESMALQGNRVRAEAVGNKLDQGVRRILGMTSKF
jgi:hypothetical protein